ncbi:hypothetical protein LCGC14_0849870 [marine sediment metagenome]|uniref:Uncharacterized protein n=1 Tax=marine sediment metagenome TaxID=412755 RepID=A0A0F9PVV3_9ZZZZ
MNKGISVAVVLFVITLFGLTVLYLARLAALASNF